jgi:hypothetical protein
MILREGNLALAQAVTIHPKAVKSPLDVSILKSVSANGKMGKGFNIITKGKWAGMPMYQMSLEERKTCPSTCNQWAACFGNNMAFAHRIDHTHPDFLELLGVEIKSLAARYKYGVVIRPHVLGDYYSPEYAAFWIEQTALYDNLYIFGFTHHLRDSVIGRMITEWNRNPRVWVRFSDQGGEMSANVDGEGFLCPEQSGKTESCLTCGACWSTTRAVRFNHH